jgi:hypothetical protein
MTIIVDCARAAAQNAVATKATIATLPIRAILYALPAWNYLVAFAFLGVAAFFAFAFKTAGSPA